MAQAIGMVKSFENGTFYVRDTKGNVRQLKLGETINQGDHVYGAYANGADAKIVIDVLLSGAGDIVLAGDGALQFDSSLMAGIFSQHDAVVHVNSLKEGLDLTAAAEAAMAEKVVAADATEAGDETAAGEEAADGTRIADSFDARTGLVTNVETDLRTTAPTRVETTVSEEPMILLEEDNLPLALADAFTTSEDTPVTGNLAGNDTPSADGGNVWTLTEGAQNGTVVINPDGTYTYTPNEGYNGPDSFTYTITDVDGDTSTTTVTIDVTPINELADASESVTVPEDGSVSGNLLDNVTDLDPDATHSVTQFVVNGTTYAAGTTVNIPEIGSLLVEADGDFTFTPLANYDGPVPVTTYTVSDGIDTVDSTLSITIIPANDNEGLSLSTANLNVTETGLNPAGTAAAGLGEKTSGSFTITDPDGLDDIKSVTIAGTTFTIGEGGIETLADIVGESIDTGYGTVTLTGYNNGTFTYDYVLDVTVDNDSVTEATGTLYNETFTVTVSDGFGDSASKEVTVGIVDDYPIFTADYLQNSVIANVGDSDAEADIIATASLGVKVGADLSGATVVITDPTPTEGGINFVTSSNGNYVTSDGEKLAYISDGSGGLNAVVVTEAGGEYNVTDDVVFSVTPIVAEDGSVSYTTTIYDVIDKYTTLSVASESISFDKMSGHYSETGTPATAVSENGTITVTFEGYQDLDEDSSIELPSEEVPVQISGQGIGVSSDHIDNTSTDGAGQMLQLSFSQPIMGYMFTADQLDTSDSLVWKAYTSTGGTVYDGAYDGADTGASDAADQVVFIGTEAAYNTLTPVQQAEIDYYKLVDGKFDTLQLTADEDSSYRILPEDVTVFYESDVPTLDFAATVTDADGDVVSTVPFTVTFEGDSVLMGSELSDVLVGSSGTDSLYGGGGNDTLVFDSSDDVIDGGEGIDTLIVAGASALDFSSLDNVSNIEVIDLSDSAGSTLENVTAADIIEITNSANDIYIIGDAGDQFDFANNVAWTQTGSDVTYEINGTVYQFNQYTSVGDPTVVVHVETELNVL
ncbi:MAG: cadherin-like domain-containing protein [Campylobacterales bacterium]|nr:cadherin-like domain-containing protein [Campylobacterales bacterium]